MRSKSKFLSRVLRLAVMAGVWFGGSASALITIETVPVGNPGNAADTAAHSGNPAGQGAVSYTYNIGKYEVTAGQYTAFLNAVGRVDTNALYNPNMASITDGSGISRSGLGTTGSPYTYTVAANFINRPVNWVSFWDATRFANWLQNGQPTGAQGAGTTETGLYTLTAGGISGNTITRNAGSGWAVTSEDEWYKAAYYNPAGSNYFRYPTGSNSVPGRDMADVSGNNANFYDGSSPYPIDSGKYTTLVGEFQNSDSPYGTFDQGGNVMEWNESILSGSYRVTRGGWFEGPGGDSDFRNISEAPIEFNGLGFRVSQVPEPTSMAVLSIGVMALMGRRAVRRE
jgi:sulfatase modifying factor 1